jgi:23S rRNA (adenine2503-C2)-methyltransferase
MKVIKNVVVPTGNILIVEGEQGPLELVSLGDYGKDKNIKADFMGLSREINGVPHGDLLPLSEKWVITISTQYGCSMGCKFCDVPKVGPGKNATADDLINQVQTGIKLHPEIKHTIRLNVHFARMGEPTWNESVIYATSYLAGLFKNQGWGFHPVISTMMPRNNAKLRAFLNNWMFIKNTLLNGEAGLQISLNTTNETARCWMFNDSALSLEEISAVLNNLKHPKGRKITLNFALTDYEINAELLKTYFDPDYFLCKITPMHLTNGCLKNGLTTDGGYENYYPYKDAEYQLKKAGFDVIVFIPSKEEDESRITCGNAILSDKEATK